MMGYATDETEELMPLTCVLAHKLNEKMSECRRNNTLPWLRPDTKTMVHHGNYHTMSMRVAYLPKMYDHVCSQHYLDIT